MQPISEEWEIQVGKNKYIVSKEEKDMILNAGEARFVKFGDFVINPAFVSGMVLLRRINNNRIEKPKDEYIPISDDKFQKLKRKALNSIGKF